MSDPTGLVTDLGAGLTGWVASMSIATALLLAAALLADRLLARRVAASWRVWLYLAVAARVALPADWHSPLGVLGRRAVSSVRIGEGVSLVAAGVPVAGSPPTTVFWIGLAYAVVALALLARWVWARVALSLELRAARPARPALATLASAPVLEHPTLGPLVAGVWRPRILVPAALAETADLESLRWVLRHEVAHILRRDQLLTAALQIGCIAAWPIVPLWIAVARVRALLELAADEHALAGTGLVERRRYGEVMLSLAELQPPSFSFVPSFGSGLRGRVRALGFSRRWPLAVQGALVAVVGAVVFACSGAADPTVPEPDSPPPAVQKPAAVRRAKPADAIPGQAAVTGSLDKEIIRRIIRRHINEVKYCYEAEIPRNPGLAGRILVQFTIAATGQVVAAVLQDSTVGNTAVEGCIVKAVRNWEFPKPLGGGIVIVSYPFVLTPAG